MMSTAYMRAQLTAGEVPGNIDLLSWSWDYASTKLPLATIK